METTVVIIDGQEYTIPTSLVEKAKKQFGAIEKE